MDARRDIRTILTRWTTWAPIATLPVMVAGWGRSIPVLVALLIALLLGAAVLAAVHHAEVVAHRVGEPFGSLVLAVAVTIIEVGLATQHPSWRPRTRRNTPPGGHPATEHPKPHGTPPTGGVPSHSGCSVGLGWGQDDPERPRRTTQNDPERPRTTVDDRGRPRTTSATSDGLAPS